MARGYFTASPPLALVAGLVSGGFLFLGIGFASLKELVGVDIGFIPLRFGNPHQRPRWGFFFIGIGLALINP
jgi:hypothetical protein